MDVENIKEIIAKFAKINKDDLDINSDLKKDLHLDSIDLFQVVMEVEETLGIKIDDSDLLDIHTVSDAINKLANAKQ